MPIKLKEISVEKHADGWYERSIQLSYYEIDPKINPEEKPTLETMLPIITHYVGKEKAMESNIDNEVLEIMTKFIISQKKPDITTSLITCEITANKAVSLLKAVR